MSLKDDLEKEVAKIFRETWTSRDGNVVPDDKDIGLGNDAVKLDATVLYADLADSTEMVDTFSKPKAAEIYKTFLLCAAKLIRYEGGAITAYDGDRIMGVFIGDSKNTTAIRTAMKINWAKNHIVNPGYKKVYTDSSYEVKHVVGIDTASLLVARTGVRGANDLVWVGRAANYAAKLSSLPESYRTYITADVYNKADTSAKMSSGVNMWTALTWNGTTIYGSTYERQI
jgi:class 3 adenylate cyclase